MIQQSPAKTKHFLKAINKAAMQQCNDIAKQIEETTKAEMQRAEDEASRDGHLRINLAKSKIEADAKMQIARFETQKKKEIYEKRNAYRTEVFEEAANRLIDFTKTDDYKTMLSNSIRALSGKVGQDLTFMYKESDTVCKECIAAHYPDAAIAVDASICIGGFKLKDADKGILIDATLDSKLAQQEEWFLLHSDLTLEI